jgi:hypothetical protein
MHRPGSMHAKLIVRCLVLALLAACSTEDASGAAGSGGAGVGGSGPCATDRIEVQQLISTEVECDLSASATQCADECELQCALDEFDLGIRGSGCAMEVDGKAYCRCLCAYCRAR